MIRKDAKVLIVEDSRTQAEHLKHLLEARGYNYVAARDGLEAVEQISLEKPDLVVSDIVMPGMDGYQLCRQLKSDPRTQDVPVILLTSLIDPSDVVKGLEAGADNFIFKPYDDEYLITRIEFALGRSSNSQREAVTDEVFMTFNGETYNIKSDRLQILNLLLSTYEEAVQRNQQLIEARDELALLNQELESRVQERTKALSAEVAERRRTEERLSEQAALLDKARDAIIVIDLDQRIQYWNRSAQRLYGWTEEEALRRHFARLVCPKGSEFAKALSQTLERGEWAGELNQIAKDASKLMVESHLTLVKDDDSRPKSILVINTDITSRKMLEEQFLRTQRLESIGILAGGVAHDLNNLLSPIIMGVDLLKETANDARIVSIVDNIGRSAKRGTDLVKQVLGFARGDQGEQAYVHLDEIVIEVQSIVEKTFPKNIRFERESAPDLWPVRTDPTQMNQVLLNICVNARDAMPDGGALRVSTSNLELDANYALTLGQVKAGRYVLLEISDEGTGMSREVIERIFDPFYTSKEPGKGTGLGLATVDRIVRNLGGFINVESEIGKGSSFKVHLPAVAESEAIAASGSREQRLPRGNGERILIVDDENAILAMTQQTLEAFGYECLTAEDGADAIALYAQRKNEIDLVFTDLMMPIMDGSTLISAIQRIDATVPIVATSGLKNGSQAAGRGNRRETRFLPKPYSAEALLTTLAAALNESA